MSVFTHVYFSKSMKHICFTEPDNHLSNSMQQTCTIGVYGGGDRDRTDDLLRARQALSQLSYTPRLRWWA